MSVAHVTAVWTSLVFLGSHLEPHRCSRTVLNQPHLSLAAALRRTDPAQQGYSVELALMAKAREGLGKPAQRVCEQQSWLSLPSLGEPHVSTGQHSEPGSGVSEGELAPWA